MKTSNKVLIAIFMLAMLFFAGVHLTLLAKYRNHDFISEEEIRKDVFVRQALPKVNFVSVKGVNNLHILASVTARVEIRKDAIKRLLVVVRNDTLFLTSSSHPDSLSLETRSSEASEDQEADLFLPGIISIEAFFSNVVIKGAANEATASNYSIHVTGSRLALGDRPYQDTSNGFFKSISIRAEGRSEVTVVNQIDSLHLELRSALFFDRNGHIRYFKFSADDQSQALLTGSTIGQAILIKQ